MKGNKARISQNFPGMGTEKRQMERGKKTSKVGVVIGYPEPMGGGISYFQTGKKSS